jgi:hypothetical protein
MSSTISTHAFESRQRSFLVVTLSGAILCTFCPSSLQGVSGPANKTDAQLVKAVIGTWEALPTQRGFSKQFVTFNADGTSKIIVIFNSRGSPRHSEGEGTWRVNHGYLIMEAIKTTPRFPIRFNLHAPIESIENGILFLRKLKNLPLTDAMNLYLDMAGFPPGDVPKSHEHPQSRVSPECPESPISPEYPVSLVSPVYPMSNGQGLEKELKDLGVRNACTERNTARKRRWQLLRDLRAVEVRLGRELHTEELMLSLYEWYRLSHPFLDPKKTPDYYLAAFLVELRKVRVPTGERDTIKNALAAVSELSDAELPSILGAADTPESWRRVLALHREMSRRVGGGTYFLSSRDAAKAFPGLCHQTANNINLILAQRAVIEIVRVGDQRPNGKASQFRYLLSESENGEVEIVA